MMDDVKSLAMIKMEKNFIAHNDKNYSRQPYLNYPIQDMANPWNSLIGFVRREMEELELSLRHLLADQNTVKRDLDISPLIKKRIPEAIYEVMLEVGDVSNTLDFLFEGLSMALHDSRQKETPK